MNPSKSPENVLKSIFPILLVLIVLIAGVILMPRLSADPRSRASEPKPAVTPANTKPRPTFPPQSNSIQPDIVCSDLYSPVCDTTKNITYPNDCEAKLAKASATTKGECGKAIALPSTN
jgi:hypothetical protein